MHRQHYTDLYRAPEEPSDLSLVAAAALTAAALASLTLFLFTL
jgi:hypothetical protein